MIYIGDKILKRCFLGDTSIGKVYLGDTLLFQHVSRLPAGYTEVEYISNPDLTYIKDLTIPDIATASVYKYKRYEFSVKFLNPDSMEDTVTGRYYYYKSGSTIREYNSRLYRKGNNLLFNKKTVVSPYPATQDKSSIIIDIPKGIVDFNGAELSMSSINTTSYRNVYPLFALYNYTNSYGESFKYQSNFQFYELKVYESTASTTENLLCDFVPCIDPNGEVGVYDIVRKLFFTHADADKVFSAGPAV